MKRHPALRPLSDDHHRALVLARRLRRAWERAGEPAGRSKTWRELAAHFASELEPHFRVEERWLLPELEAAGERALAARALADHSRLRELATGEASADAAKELAKLLDDHVRFEERELFPAAERLLEARAKSRAERVAEAVREACVDAALAGYEDASLRGLCHEGAWEAAVGAIRSAPLDALVERIANAEGSGEK